MDVEAVARAETMLREQGVVDDDRMRWAAAVGAVQLLIRRSNDALWEEWHSEPGGLSDGEMMRAKTAMTRLVHAAVDLVGSTR